MTPQTWRLASRYRTSAPAFMRLASRVRSGEWTTSGHLYRGARRHQGCPGRWPRRRLDPRLPYPERVLMDGGFTTRTGATAQAGASITATDCWKKTAFASSTTTPTTASASPGMSCAAGTRPSRCWVGALPRADATGSPASSTNTPRSHEVTQSRALTGTGISPVRPVHLSCSRPQPRRTNASHSIAITGMFNAHHTRARLSCHQEPIHAAPCQL